MIASDRPTTDTPPTGAPPAKGRVLAGVCAGMGAAWRVDPLALRIAFLAGTLLLFPAGALLYLACWILMPAADE